MVEQNTTETGDSLLITQWISATTRFTQCSGTSWRLKAKQVADEHTNKEDTAPSTSTETTGNARLQEAANFPYKIRSRRTDKPPKRLGL